MTPAMKYFSPLLLLVVLGLTSCGSGIMVGTSGSSPPCGAAGQPCCGWPGTNCRGSVSCDHTHNICGACGYEGGPCCSNSNPAAACANANLFCNSTATTPFRCEACGHIGQPSCNNNTCVTGVYSGGRCIAPGPGDLVCNGSTPFLIGIRDRRSHCRVDEFPVRANSRDDAKRCAESAARSAALPEPEAVDATHAQQFPLTISSSFGRCDVIQRPAYSIEDAEFCARYTYVDRTVERIPPSSCPTPTPTP